MVRAAGVAERLRQALAAGAPDAVLHFSRRSANAFLAEAEAAGESPRLLDATHLCLSAEVAAVLTGAGARTVRAAARPEEAALIALVAGL
jgi:uroporphyrinogen-III synthase